MAIIAEARRPQVGYDLSGVVLVTSYSGDGVAYIKFGCDLVGRVGLLLPEGIAPYRKAYLSLVEWPNGTWHLYAQYVYPPAPQVEVEVYAEAPQWLKLRRR